MNFENWLENDGMKKNTIKSYLINMKLYNKYCVENFGSVPEKLYRQNVLDYKSYLMNTKEVKGETINAKLYALAKYNDYLLDQKIQEEIAISRRDYIRIQTVITNPSKIQKKDVEEFRQLILETNNARNYAIITVMAYAGLRISEVLSLKSKDINLTTREVLVRSGTAKGQKQRVVYLNDKIVNSIRSHIKKNNVDDQEFLFLSNRGGKIERSVINRLFNKYSEIITPHELRHFFCSHALESGFSIHEVAYMAGHSNITVTSKYTNPSIEKMKEKVNRL